MNRRCLSRVFAFSLGAAIACSPAAAGGPEPEAWTLARLLEEARGASRTIAAREREVDGAEAAAREITAASLPRLSFGGSYLHTTETMRLDLPSFGSFDPPEVRFGDGNTYDLKLDLSSPLFTGGTLFHQRRAGEAAARASRHVLAAEDLRLSREVRRAYFAALGAEARAEAARIAEARFHRHAEDVASAASAGMASEERRVQTLARLRQAEQARLRAEAEARIERINLGRLAGRLNEEIAPSGDLDASLVPVGLPEGTTVDARPELAALSDLAEQGARLERAAQGAYYPTLAAQAAFHHAKPGVDAIANEWVQYGTVGLTLSWPLWEWGARGERVRQARAAKEALEEERAELRKNLESALQAARVRAESAREEEARAAERVDLESRRVGFVRSRYREAAASESELLDALADLAAAEIDVVLAKAGVRLAEAEILYCVGY
ncbi:MAG: TolC family protein [Candidatus Eisenbacteria bacterium]|nr:TolC family protein [Candidatus Eisenbacteria bacterium]